MTDSPAGSSGAAANNIAHDTTATKDFFLKRMEESIGRGLNCMSYLTHIVTSSSTHAINGYAAINAGNRAGLGLNGERF
ncbi:hypothetical protein [Pseudomonas palleroniana]|uniref:hypothetical protein n=1 Tax=Pseudomonas palleroniana TaxID=191390 RepID=UPI001FD217FE|nr:hypothetical protein [Pseudomonas palleroniana]UOP13916.1 hypothetical protein LDL65_27905 [Pseudomonas palleroniana]